MVSLAGRGTEQYLLPVGDIKQEPGSPPQGGEEGGWGEVGAGGGGGKGDCLYDIVSASQTRFKPQQDNRNLIR